MGTVQVQYGTVAVAVQVLYNTVAVWEQYRYSIVQWQNRYSKVQWQYRYSKVQWQYRYSKVQWQWQSSFYWAMSSVALGEQTGQHWRTIGQVVFKPFPQLFPHLFIAFPVNSCLYPPSIEIPILSIHIGADQTTLGPALSCLHETIFFGNKISIL